MNAQDVPPQTATGFWSIERVVAFIVGPLVAAGAGWLSTFLARELGVPIAAETIVGVFGIGTLTAGGLAYKWLHGRQLEMTLKHNAVIEQLAREPYEGIIHTSLHDLEGLAQNVVEKYAQQIRSDLPPPPAPLSPGATTADQGAAPTA